MLYCYGISTKSGTSSYKIIFIKYVILKLVNQDVNKLLYLKIVNKKNKKILIIRKIIDQNN